MTQGPLSCSGSALTWVFPSLLRPISVGGERTFILFSALQRHRAWDIRSGIGMLRPLEQASLPKHASCEYNH